MVTDEESELCELLQVSAIKLIPNEDALNTAFEISDIDSELCPRCRRFVAGENAICTRCDSVLTSKMC